MDAETLKYYIALQPKFREAMGEWQVRDFFYDSDLEKVCCSFGHKHMDSKDIRLPLLIDPRCPERALVGMIKGFQYIKYASTWLCCIDASNPTYFEGITPELALLHALVQQEGIEVK